MGNFYDDMVQVSVIPRELEYRGQKKTVYFRQLTAGQRIQISRGQRMTVGSKSREEGVEVDVGESLERTHKFLAFANVDAQGNPVFKSHKEVQELPEDLVAELQRLADDALKADAVAVGNV
jgi:hypothetical protein